MTHPNGDTPNPLIANESAAPQQPASWVEALRNLPLFIVEKEPNGEGGHTINASAVKVNIIDKPDEKGYAAQGIPEEESGDVEAWARKVMEAFDEHLIIPIITNAANSGYQAHDMLLYLLAEFQDRPVEVIHTMLAVVLSQAAMEIRLNPN